MAEMQMKDLLLKTNVLRKTIGSHQMSGHLEAQLYPTVEHLTCLGLEDIPQPCPQFSVAYRKAQGQVQLQPPILLQADQLMGLEGRGLQKWSQGLPVQVSLDVSSVTLTSIH